MLKPDIFSQSVTALSKPVFTGHRSRVLELFKRQTTSMVFLALCLDIYSHNYVLALFVVQFGQSMLNRW